MNQTERRLQIVIFIAGTVIAGFLGNVVGGVIGLEPVDVREAALVWLITAFVLSAFLKNEARPASVVLLVCTPVFMAVHLGTDGVFLKFVAPLYCLAIAATILTYVAVITKPYEWLANDRVQVPSAMFWSFCFGLRTIVGPRTEGELGWTLALLMGVAVLNLFLSRRSAEVTTTPHGS